MRPITSFTGEYFCLSNFYPARVRFEGIEYPTSEHAYQAAKTTDVSVRRSIQRLHSPRAAKREGRLILLRPGWEGMKVQVMEQILLDKFRRNDHIRFVLLSTDNRTLVEGNTWGDVEWGVVDGIGENKLGKVLMRVRDALRKG